ncbi:MAG: hypothetical protein H7Y32_20950 [Chloroflexales bacterium]|jgi:uncharacterized protein YbaR (Trm112 family)|nr:hypothetical protein [Chloroflexales bacterium]
MKAVVRILGLVALVGVVLLIVRAIRQYREDSVFDLAPATAGAAGGERRGISPELLEILADPADKGPVELLTDGSGKEWLINRRNGFRYPVEDGIPIMLIEEGEKNKDESLIQG